MLFGGNLPIGAGLSSSASICVGTACVVDRLWDVGAEPLEKVAVVNEGGHWHRWIERRPIQMLVASLVVVAIGTRANPLLTATCPELKLNKWGNIIVDERSMTNLPGVFAGGDIVRGAATVILAMGDGKRAAAAIDRYLQAQPAHLPVATG